MTRDERLKAFVRGDLSDALKYLRFCLQNTYIDQSDRAELKVARATLCKVYDRYQTEDEPSKGS